MERIKIDNTYEILLNDGNNGEKFRFEALRHGEPWRNLVGDNMVLAMFYKIEKLQNEVNRLNDLVNSVHDLHKNIVSEIRK